MEISKITKHLIENANIEEAYFAFIEWSDQEYCIRANDHGLKLFAAKILQATELKKNETTLGFETSNDWYCDELEINFIERTLKKRSEILMTKEPEKESKWTGLVFWMMILLLAYFITTGSLYTIQWLNN